jgi:LuxR family glucitol operon transcriptional activator
MNPLLESEARRRWCAYYIGLLDANIKRETPSEMYWNCLLGRNLDMVKQEWPNIHRLLDWVCKHRQDEQLIELVLRLSHFLSRVNLQLRIDLGNRAAEAAGRMGRSDLEALFLIDTTGWALIEIGQVEEGRRQIQAGLEVLEQADLDRATARHLMILGKAFVAKSHLKLNRIAEAAAIIVDIRSLDCTPVIEHRVLLVQGDLCLQMGQLQEAVGYYEEANELSHLYGGEKTIEAYYYLGIAYIGLGESAKAETVLEQILYHKSNPNQIELIYYYYGKAQLANLQEDREVALNFTKQALAIIDSWERTFWLRHEIERLYKQLLSD